MDKPHRKSWPKSKTSDISKHSPSPLHHTFLLGRARFIAQPLSALVTDFKTRVLTLKPEVQILGFSKSICHKKVEILRLKPCFLPKKETKLTANLWKAFSTELFCRRSWWPHVVLLNDLHLARKPSARSSFARPAMPFVNQQRLVLKFPVFA